MTARDRKQTSARTEPEIKRFNSTRLKAFPPQLMSSYYGFFNYSPWMVNNIYPRLTKSSDVLRPTSVRHLECEVLPSGGTKALHR
ncbi:unnamed protein product [Clavelina lepadiformis]|uniref:Uncharacterized protein n=1 Tax=Clavelina lepadiformis TaxID=159417 RepID=A0ABP0F4P2_CLALP